MQFPDLERYKQDALYFEEHRREFLDQYRGKWVAVYDGRVVGATTELTVLLALMNRQGLPQTRVFVEHVRPRNRESGDVS